VERILNKRKTRGKNKYLVHWKGFVRATRVELQEISQLIIVYELLLQPTSRRFLRELDEAPGGNTLHYILQCLRIPASVTRVWTRKVRWVAMECSWNDESETQYYVVILDQLQGRSGGLERVPELRVRGPLTGFMAESDTWEGRENLKNAKEVIEEFKKEYQRDMEDVARQECEEATFKRGELLGRFTAKKLYRWSDMQYDQAY